MVLREKGIEKISTVQIAHINFLPKANSKIRDITYYVFLTSTKLPTSMAKRWKNILFPRFN